MKAITVDSRENADELFQALTEIYGFEIIRKQLQLGDYFLPPDTTIERKTTNDFAISIIDGRLFKQAYRLVEITENPILIIEGESFQGLNVSNNAIRGALICLAQTFRIPVLRTKDQKDTAWHINQLCEQRERIGSNKGARKGYLPKKLETQKEYILRSLPGVGTKIAKILLDEFGSVKNLANAEEQEIAKVPGIGKTKATKIYQILRENKSPYGIN
ncbi:MAG: ERCC4 domain-containing protein [Candidatus Nanoarchaeia archaeon]